MIDSGTPLACPVEPYEMDKALRAGMEDIVRRVVCAVTMQGAGRDLMLRVYLAGLSHGVELTKRERAAA